MMRRPTRTGVLRSMFAFVAALSLAVGASSANARDNRSFDSASARATVDSATLPAEARRTLALIHAGGPFPYARKDGTVFGNREGRLPRRPRGYYREFTVPMPGARDRGPRRIIAGSGPDGDVRTSDEYWYTDDHYATFRRIVEPDRAEKRTTR